MKATRGSGYTEGHSDDLLTALLDIGLNELFCVDLEDIVYLVQKVVELCLDSVARIRRHRLCLNLGSPTLWRWLS